jgi:hypothetical protein
MKKWAFISIAIIVIGGGAAALVYFKNSANKIDTSKTSISTNTAVTQPTGTKSISTVINDNKQLATFASAIKSALLTDTLDGTAPYTVLAPSESAFKTLPVGTLDMLLKLENSTRLKNILTYHIIPSAIKTSDLTEGQRLKTVNGQELIVHLSDSQVIFVDAKGGKAVVTKADVSASNGFVDTIDAVLIPQ